MTRQLCFVSEGEISHNPPAINFSLIHSFFQKSCHPEIQVRRQMDGELDAMTIANGTQLGHYEIRSKLGAGGMGEVYLAHDTKLDRKVALKILSSEVAADPNRISRFVQEAKAASALNHPNIITIHEIDSYESG